MINNIRNWIANKTEEDSASIAQNVQKEIEQITHDATAGQLKTSGAWTTHTALSTSRNQFLSTIVPAGTQVVTVSDITLIPSTAQPTSHIGGFPLSGAVYIDSATGTIYTTSAQLPPKELSTEEKQKLKNLEEDRKRETKKAKLNIFKKLPANLRQSVVDQLMWRDAVNAMNSTEAAKSLEQIELEKRDLYTNVTRGYIAGGSGGVAGIAQSVYLGDHLHSSISTASWMPIMPVDITSNELLRAHAEATAEEALLGTDTESK